MDIATTNTPQFKTTPGVPAIETETTSVGAAISSDFETFLTMLTVQLENQDPLNPVESTDYAVQLATFSGVEQQVKTNDLLTAVSEQLGAMGMSDLAGWVGMEARAVAPAWFEDQPITLQPDPASGADQALAVVRDRYGTELDRIEVTMSDQPLVWSGTDAAGTPFPPGQYTFHLVSLSQGEIIGESQMPVYAQVTEARVEKGETILVLDGGVEVPASEVDALRAPVAVSATSNG